MASLRAKGEAAEMTLWIRGYESRDTVGWLSTERSEGFREEVGIPELRQQYLRSQSRHSSEETG